MAVTIALAASMALAACGGSGSRGAGSASIKNDRLKYAACMRAHGVPDYPDPGANAAGGAIEITAGKVTVGGRPLSESWSVVRPAADACEKDLEPSFGPRYSGAQLAKIRSGALAMSRCMREHGLSSYPDLKVTAGPGGHGFSVSAPHLSHADAISPAFRKDNLACSELLNRSVPGRG